MISLSYRNVKRVEEKDDEYKIVKMVILISKDRLKGCRI